MPSIQINDLICTANDVSAEFGVTFAVERVLCIESDSETVVLIHRYDRKAVPYSTSLAGIESSIEAGIMRIFTDLERDNLMHSDEFFIEMKMEASLQKRDKAWAVICDYTSDSGMYKRSYRRQIIKLLEMKTGITDDTILGYFRRFWQRGQLRNTLMGDYKNCGSNTQRKNDKKRGRRPNGVEDAVVLENNNVVPETKALLQRGYDEFYRGGVTLQFALDRTIDKYFLIGTQPVLKQGKVIAVPIRPPLEKQPTITQFKFHCHIPRDREKVDARHKAPGESSHANEPRSGSITMRAKKPGQYAGFDGTPFPIRLVNRINPAIQYKNPFVNILVCFYTRLLMGINVTLDPESYMEAAVTIVNAGTDKVEYAADYGIAIKSEEWPGHHYPEHIVADQAALRGYNADNITANTLQLGGLGTTVHLNPGGTPELNGIVEGVHSILKRKLQDIADTKALGSKTPVDGVLTLDEFRAAMIEAVVEYNTTTFIAPEGYPVEDWMLEGDIVMSPANLWLRGIERKGEPPSTTQEILKRNLLPIGKLNITKNGAFFGKWKYESTFLQGLVAKAAGSGTFQVSMRSDPRLINYIYIETKDQPETKGSKINKDNSLQRAELAKIHDAFWGLSFAEANSLLNKMNSHKSPLDEARKQKEVERRATNDAMKTEGMKRRRMAQIENEAINGKQSKTAQRKAMPDNKRLEADHERQKRAWVLDSEFVDEMESDETQPVHDPSSTLTKNNLSVSQPDYSAKLLKLREDAKKKQ